jgi:hypothetical protein
MVRDWRAISTINTDLLLDLETSPCDAKTQALADINSVYPAVPKLHTNFVFPSVEKTASKKLTG